MPAAFSQVINCSQNQSPLQALNAIGQCINESEAVSYSQIGNKTISVHHATLEGHFLITLDDIPSTAAPEFMQQLVKLIKAYSSKIEKIHAYYILTELELSEPITCLEDYPLYAKDSKKLNLDHLKVLLNFVCSGYNFSPYSNTFPFAVKRWEIYLSDTTSFAQLLTIFDIGTYHKIFNNQEDKGLTQFSPDTEILLYFSPSFLKTMYCKYDFGNTNECPYQTYSDTASHIENITVLFNDTDSDYLKPALQHNALLKHSSSVCNTPENTPQILNLYRAYNKYSEIKVDTCPSVTRVMLTRKQLNAFEEYGILLQQLHIEQSPLSHPSPDVAPLLTQYSALSISANQLHTLSQDDIINLISNPDAAVHFAQHLQLCLKKHPDTITYPAGKELLKTLSKVLNVIKDPKDNSVLIKELLQKDIIDTYSLSILQKGISASLLLKATDLQTNVDKMLSTNNFAVQNVYCAFVEAAQLLVNIYETPVAASIHRDESHMNNNAINERRFKRLLEYPHFLESNSHTNLFPLLLDKDFSLPLLLVEHALSIQCIGLHYKAFVFHDNCKFSLLELMYHDLIHHALELSYQVGYSTLTDFIQREACYKHIYPFLKWIQFAEHNTSWGENFNHHWLKALQQYDLTMKVNGEHPGCSIHNICSIILFICIHEHFAEESGIFQRWYDAPIPTFNQFAKIAMDSLVELNYIGKPFTLRKKFSDWHACPPAGYHQLPINNQSPVPLFLAIAWLHFCMQSFASGLKDFTDNQYMENFFSYLQPHIALRVQLIKLAEEGNLDARRFIKQCRKVEKTNLASELMDFQKTFDPSRVGGLIKLSKLLALT